MSVTLHGEPGRFEGGLHAVAEGVFAWLQPDGGWGEVNAGLVVGDGAAGRSAMQGVRALIREPEFARFRDWKCPERIVLNATTIHRRLAGKPPVPSTPPARARLFAHIAAIGRELEALPR